MKIQPAPEPQGRIKGVAFGGLVPYCIDQVLQETVSRRTKSTWTVNNAKLNLILKLINQPQ